MDRENSSSLTLIMNITNLVELENKINGNVLENYTDAEIWDKFSSMSQSKAILASVLLLFSMATVFGNSLVIAAVVRERYLHTATNYFVTSLALADCLVGLVVMPFSAIYEVFQHNWFFGLNWCDVWRSLDVLFSTASILNLCVISLDRYWAITDPFIYPTRMSDNRACLLIAAIWICSGAISFPAILWWRAVRTETVPVFKCPFTDNLGYLIFSSTISFYLPLFVMVFTYYKIYRAAVEQTRSLKLGTKQVMMNVTRGEMELTLRIHRGKGLVYENSSLPDEVIDYEKSLPQNGISRQNPNFVHGRHLGKNFSLSRKLSKFAKEKKAAKTLGIVMGVFIICWLPFFVVNLLSGFCTYCIYEEELVSAIVTWLGWINSGMNPVIYVCWSKDFRRSLSVMPSTLIDNYWHPNHQVIYIKKSVFGQGVDEDLWNECYEICCNCELSSDGSCETPDECDCVKTFSTNYVNGRLCDNKLFGSSSVFECGRNCGCSIACANSISQKGPHSHLRITTDFRKGYCLITDVNIPKGTFVCEYAGEIIGEEEAKKMNQFGDTYVVTIREHCTDTVIETRIDARYKANIGRNINHSCDPNCVLVPVRFGKYLPMAGIFTCKEVKAGEELTYHYNPGSNKLSTTQCFCATSNCLQFLPTGL